MAFPDFHIFPQSVVILWAGRMGQLMSILGLLYVRDCDTKLVINDLTLFPPYPVFCMAFPWLVMEQTR